MDQSSRPQDLVVGVRCQYHQRPTLGLPVLETVEKGTPLSLGRACMGWLKAFVYVKCDSEFQ
jgi:hypothetical protein